MDQVSPESRSKKLLDLFGRPNIASIKPLIKLYLCQDMFPRGQICQKHPLPQCALHCGVQEPLDQLVGCRKRVASRRPVVEPRLVM